MRSNSSEETHLPMAPSSVVYILDFSLLTLFLLLPPLANPVAIPEVFILSSSLDIMFWTRFLFLCCEGAADTAKTHHITRINTAIPLAEVSGTPFFVATFILHQFYIERVRVSISVITLSLVWELQAPETLPHCQSHLHGV